MLDNEGQIDHDFMALILGRMKECVRIVRHVDGGTEIGQVLIHPRDVLRFHSGNDHSSLVVSI